MKSVPPSLPSVSRRSFLHGAGASAAAAALAVTPGASAAAASPGAIASPGRGGGRVFALIIGSLRLPVIQRLAGAGRMPAFARLLREGALAPELLNLCANKSHAAVISALTGATPGTHRAITILRSENGRPPLRQDLLGRICQSEFLWDAAERQGKQVIVFNVPDSWPPKLRRGVVIGGASLTINATLYEGIFDRAMGYPTFRYALAADELFATESAAGWTGLQFEPVGASAARATGVNSGLAARLALRCDTPDRELVRKPVLWLVAPREGGEVRIHEEGRWAVPLGRVVPGQWSARLDFTVATAAGPVAIACRIKLLSFDATRGQARLYVSPLGPIHDGRTVPAKGIPALATLRNFPIAASVVMNRAAALLDPASQRELLAMSGDWYLEALEVLLRRPFDLFAFHTNDLDWGEHAANKHYRNGLGRAACEQFIDGLYEDLDRQLARILQLLPPDTSLLLMTPHGIICPWHIRGGRNTADMLAEAGLLQRTAGGDIDYERSQAYPAPEGEGLVDVNPHQPRNAAEEEARAKNLRLTCRVLSSAVRGPERDRVFTVVLPWDEAAPFGLKGPRLADIVTLRPAEDGGMHGPCFPLTAPEESTLKGFMLGWGPGVVAGRRETRPVYPEDFAPTVAHLLGMRPPADSEGRVLYRLLP